MTGIREAEAQLRGLINVLSVMAGLGEVCQGLFGITSQRPALCGMEMQVRAVDLLRWLRQLRVDLIVLDMMLPNLECYAVICQIRLADSDTPIVAQVASIRRRMAKANRLLPLHPPDGATGDRKSTRLNSSHT